jgi:hypothetical protein
MLLVELPQARGQVVLPPFGRLEQLPQPLPAPDKFVILAQKGKQAVGFQVLSQRRQRPVV